MAKPKTAVHTAHVAADKQQAALDAVAAIEKQHGKGSIVRLGDKIHIQHPCTPTGIYSVDEGVIQAGGFPLGRIVEVFGPESGGKTTLALTVIAQAQAKGGLCAFVDAEHALDPRWANINGVNVADLYVSQPDTGEQALEITETLVRSGAYEVIVVDSVAALVPAAELSGEMGDSNMGSQARLMSQAMRKLIGSVSKTNTCLIFINQIREKIGVMFGSPETTTGGRALKFFSSVRLDVRRIGAIKEGEKIIGNKVKIKGVKNKLGAPFREAEIDLLFDSGFDAVGSVVDAAVALDIIKKSGSWFSYSDQRVGQGRSNVVELLKGDAELYSSVYSALKAFDLVKKQHDK